MIETLKFTNLKSYIETDDIALNRLTLLCGSNSSGKSSILQALLMLSQTFSARQSSNSIVLNGPLARLGALEDIKSHHSESDLIKIKFRLNHDGSRTWYDGPSIIELDLSFGTKKKTAGSEESLHPPIQKIKMCIRNSPGDLTVNESIEVIPAKQPYRLGIREYHYDYEVVDIKSENIAILEKEYPDYTIIGCRGPLLPRAALVLYNYTKKISSHVLSAVCGKAHILVRHAVTDPLDIELPPELFLEINKRIDDERATVKAALINSNAYKKFVDLSKSGKRSGLDDFFAIQDDLINTTFSLSGKTISPEFINTKSTIREWMVYLESLDYQTRRALVEFIDKHRLALQEIWYSSVEDKEQRIEEYSLKYISHASQLLKVEFPRSIKYLKPLRNEPSAVYPFMDQELGTNIGLKGEYTAAVLHSNKHRKIRYPKPYLNERHEFNWAITNASLQEACHDWLSYLGVVKKVETTDKGKLGYELQVKIADKDRSQDLTHVGVGVSQILPILVMCLLAESDNILVLEQPELHLHPKVQSKLCDFFIAMAGFNRQCLVETHSEYMINRLRLRIAQGNNERLAEEAPIYFIEKSEITSSIRRVEINRFGVIQDWPEDFFDQTDREVEAILAAAAHREYKERAIANNGAETKTKPTITRKRRDANSDQR
ncbi:AAA family ATPase [Pseudomonas asiatica]|uniref:AAA family ATPase n=1 Tax=Pseudomonas asiatica TaxID=2219225 RepID=UPI0037C608E9